MDNESLIPGVNKEIFEAAKAIVDERFRIAESIGEVLRDYESTLEERIVRTICKQLDKEPCKTLDEYFERSVSPLRNLRTKLENQFGDFLKNPVAKAKSKEEPVLLSDAPCDYYRAVYDFSLMVKKKVDSLEYGNIRQYCKRH